MESPSDSASATIPWRTELNPGNKSMVDMDVVFSNSSFTEPSHLSSGLAVFFFKITFWGTFFLKIFFWTFRIVKLERYIYIWRYQIGRYRSSIIVVQSWKMLPLAGWLSELCRDPDFHEPTAFFIRNFKRLYQLLQHGTNIPVPVFKGKGEHGDLFYQQKYWQDTQHSLENVINLHCEAHDRLFQVAK